MGYSEYANPNGSPYCGCKSCHECSVYMLQAKVEDLEDINRNKDQKIHQLDSEYADLRRKAITNSLEIEQILGKALGYPWYKDDQKNFPGSTDADGVCVGEHTDVTLAMEAADHIRDLEAEGYSLLRRLLKRFKR